MESIPQQRRRPQAARVGVAEAAPILLVGMLMCTGSALAQSTAPAAMGAVATRDARVNGGLEVQGELARLLSNASVTAFDHTANVALTRGGEVLVCATSEFHLLRSGVGSSLLFGLDRGAMEVRSASQPQDMVLTPDIRFSMEAAGKLDLRMRVTREGDTCVDNAGMGAPVLLLENSFTGASYRLLPGQHVLFEKGDLREVVDHERTSCGCPESASVAPATQVAAAHPFPTAVSEGLEAAGLPGNEHGDGAVGAQVSTTLSYGPGSSPPVAVANAGVPQPTQIVSAEPPQTPPGAKDIASAVKRFFRRVFGGKDSSPARPGAVPDSGGDKH